MHSIRYFFPIKPAATQAEHLGGASRITYPIRGLKVFLATVYPQSSIKEAKVTWAKSFGVIEKTACGLPADAHKV